MARRHMHRGSSRKLEGNLCDLCVHRLLEICRHNRVTGVLRINTWGRSALVQFENGQVGAVRFRVLEGERALDELLALRDGIFELISATPISLDVPVTAMTPARAASAPEIVTPEIMTPEPAASLARPTIQPPRPPTLIQPPRPPTLIQPPPPRQPTLIQPPMAHSGTQPQADAQASWQPGLGQPWPAPTWNEHPSQPAWPQLHDTAAQASWMRRLPPLGPALGFGLLGFMLLIMVAIQL